MENTTVNNQPQNPQGNGGMWAVIIVIAALVIGGYMLWGRQATDETENLTENSEQTMETETGDNGLGGDEVNSETVTPTTTTPTNTTEQTGSEKVFTVEGSNFKFSPSEIKVKKGDKVKIIFNNTGGFHDFVIDEFNVKTSQIAGGKSETIEFVADKTGTFEFYCSVGSHRAMGMKGNFIVE